MYRLKQPSEEADTGHKAGPFAFILSSQNGS
eukprot:COSAG06_NODE_51336_length_313_cov_0.392523_1_plen_30_part_10